MTKGSETLFRDALVTAAADELRNIRYRPQVTHRRLKKSLTLAREEGHLVLVLGAGISFDSRIGGWRDLVEEAASLLFALSKIPKMVDVIKSWNKPLTIQARFCENSAKVKTAYRAFLVDALYRDFDPNIHNANLEAICDLVFDSTGKPKITDILTYNFDNLVELALCERQKALGSAAQILPIVCEQTYRQAHSPNVIRVFHPHGYLPFGKTLGEISKLPIVFSETDYHRSFVDPTYWANTVQLDAFARKRCLFIGLSFECPNMRRLLDYVQFGARPAYEHIALMRRLRPDPQNLRCYLTATDLKSLGVQPLWFDNFASIPDLLRSI